MYEVVKTLHSFDYHGPIRPDHGRRFGAKQVNQGMDYMIVR